MPGPRRKRLLYASPFPPMKSGISDYSEVLIYGLREHFDITLLIDDYRLENKNLYEDFKVKVYRKDPLVFNLFDHWVYNIGNNPHFHSYIYECALKKPGLIILHDFVEYYLTIGHYQNKGRLYSKLYELEGANTLHLVKEYTKKGMDPLECKHLAPQLPLNIELIRSENKFLVHSEYTYQKLSARIQSEGRLRKINHVDLIGDNIPVTGRQTLFSRYDIPENAVLLSSFGSIDRTKLNHVVCQTVNSLNEKFDNKLVYLMVGAGDYIDEYLSPNIKKTGYVDLVDFNSFIRCSDVVINLRHPTMGETSGAIIRALGLGRPCIVSDDAWFSELPGDVVIKVSNKDIKKDLYDSLSRLLESPDLMDKISKRAKDYIQREHGITKISDEIADFLRA